MKIRSLVAAANIGLVFLLMIGLVAEASEIKVLSAVGIQPVIEELGPKFEHACGHKLTITFRGVGGIVKRVQGGETADVIIIPQQGIDGFLKDGKVAPGNVTVLARSGTGVAVRKGAPKPDISSPEALKRTLLAAKSVAYGNPETSASGSHFTKVLDRLGIADEMKSKTIRPPPKSPNEAGLLVAKGEAEIAVQLISQLVLYSDIDIVGPLPGDLQDDIIFAAAVMAGAKDTAAAKALVDFLRTPEATAVIKAKGMEPATP